MKPRRKGYAMPQIIVFAAVGCVGLAFLYIGLTEVVTQRRLLARAVPVRAEIVHSSVRESRSADTDHRLLRDNSTTSYTVDVRFRYQVNGSLFESDTIRPTVIVQGHGSRSSAEAEIAPFPVGATVDAWVDPQLPDRAFLVRGSFAGPMVFTILGLLLPPVGWLASRLV
ncbi:MAG TPA: DUF3592 domain-containing protein [Phycisphaerales bacterium]|nr:DUF3592 domain-containing protein [Phycisphaerales bacterium]